MTFSDGVTVGESYLTRSLTMPHALIQPGYTFHLLANNHPLWQRYQIKHLIEDGSTAVLHLAISSDPSDNKPYVIKAIQKSTIERRGDIWEDEVTRMSQMIKGLSHDNICRLVEYFAPESTICKSQVSDYSCLTN